MAIKSWLACNQLFGSRRGSHLLKSMRQSSIADPAFGEKSVDKRDKPPSGLLSKLRSRVARFVEPQAI